MGCAMCWSGAFRLPVSKMTWSTSGLSLSCTDVLTSQEPWPLDTSAPQSTGCSLWNTQARGRRQQPLLQLHRRPFGVQPIHRIQWVWITGGHTRPHKENCVEANVFLKLRGETTPWMHLNTIVFKFIKLYLRQSINKSHYPSPTFCFTLSTL